MQFWSVLFTAGLADLFSRLLVAATKALIIASAPAASQQTLRRRGGMLTALDYLAAALRAVVPAPLWVAYFRHAGLASPISIVLSGIYILFKAANMIERVSLAGVAMAQWQGAVHGAPPTPEELTAGIQECSICQDEFRSPLRLTCGHIFCGSCIGEWLDREATCPMCRSVVRRATLRPKNDGSTSLLPLLC